MGQECNKFMPSIKLGNDCCDEFGRRRRIYPCCFATTNTVHEFPRRLTPAKVFISYSHDDEAWKDRLVAQLGVLQQQHLLETWDDRQIAAGDNWQPHIELAMAQVAVLLISASFLTSQFILGTEVPELLRRRAAQGLRVIPLIIKPCAWSRVDWLNKLQARPTDGKPLLAGSEY